MSRPSFPRPPRNVLLVALLGLFALAIFGAARIARNKGLQVVHASADARGWGLSVKDVRTRLDGRVRFQSVCISLLQDAHQDLCLDDLRVHVSPLSVLRGNLAIDAVSASALRIDTDGTRLRQLRAREEREASEGKGGRRVDSLARVRIDEVSIQVRDAERGLHATLQNLLLEADDEGWELRTAGELRSVEGVDELVSAAVAGLTGQTFQLTSYWDREGSHLRDASLVFDEQVVLSVPLREQVELRLAGFAFVDPYAIRILEPSAELPEHGLKVRAEAIQTQVGHWTTYLPDFYLASMTIESPVVDVPTSKARETLAMLRSLSAELLEARREALGGSGEDAAGEDDGSSNTADDASGEAARAAERLSNNTAVRERRSGGPSNSAGSVEGDEEPPSAPPQVVEAPPAGSLKAELARRRWWEIAPRAIRVENASLRFHAEEADAAALRLDDFQVQYGLRVLHRQLDVEVSGQLRYDEEDAGRVELQAEWDYEHEVARASWKLASLDLLALRGLVPSERLELDSGRLHLEGRVRSSKNTPLSGEHAIRVEDLHVAHPRLQQPLTLQHASASGPILLEREGGRATLVFESQALELEEAKAELSLVFTDFRLLQRPRASQVDVLFEVADQPAMRLFSSIPVSLRGPVADAQMGGEWGLTLGFRIEQTGFLDDGRALWEIGGPSVYHLRDRQLTLESLPDAVDVRRLNRAMSFTFRGPNDSMMRQMRIPGPGSGAELDGTSPNDGGQTGGWVPLRAMSYYFVATQLYREDGSFFRNTGINWLQLRRVLSEALTTRQLSRGASTITMQTVKNVFLSHERSIERKLQELFLSYWMTRAVPKARILEVYLNIIELGPGRNGADEASRFHFGTSIRDLELRESVWLSSISPNPVRIGGTQAKGDVPIGACVRCDRLIEGLFTRGWLDASEHRAGLGSLEPPAALPPGAWAPQGQPTGGHSSGTLPFDLQSELDLATPPLFDLLQEDESVPNSVDRLPLRQRLEWWINESKPPRGTGALRR